MPKKFSTRVSLSEQINELNVSAGKVIDENLVWTDRTTYEKVVFSVPFLVFSMLTYIFIIGVFLMLLRNSAWNKRLRTILPLTTTQIYKKVLEESYTNISIASRGPSISNTELKGNRGEGIPNDAWIISRVDSPTFNLDGSTANMSIVTWKWKRDKDYHTATKTYFRAYNLSTKYNDLDFSIYKNTLVRINRGKDMENNEFNKRFSFKHDNPVKFRMLFTVSSQEKFVNLKKARALSSFSILKNGDWLFFSHNKIGTPFSTDVRMITNNRGKLKGQIISDLQSDLLAILQTFEVIYSMPTILR